MLQCGAVTTLGAEGRGKSCTPSFEWTESWRWVLSWSLQSLSCSWKHWTVRFLTIRRAHFFFLCDDTRFFENICLSVFCQNFGTSCLLLTNIPNSDLEVLFQRQGSLFEMQKKPVKLSAKLVKNKIKGKKKFFLKTHFQAQKQGNKRHRKK